MGERVERYYFYLVLHNRSERHSHPFFRAAHGILRMRNRGVVFTTMWAVIYVINMKSEPDSTRYNIVIVAAIQVATMFALRSCVY